MKLRHVSLLFAVIAVAACGGGEPAVDTSAPETPVEAPMDDAAALDEKAEYFVTHYNMHHADMVAALYARDAVVLSADGSVREGRAVIQAAMETDMASNPTLRLDVADRVINRDWAVSHGVWQMETTPEWAAEPLALEGHFMTVSRKIDGEWKTTWSISNYHSDPPEGAPPGGPPADSQRVVTGSLLAELADYYATHYNMGHGDMVASRYAEDAMAAFANMPVAVGRAAIAERLNARITEGDNPQLTIHEVGAGNMGDGWVVGGGWYEAVSSAGETIGSFMMLCRTGADGNLEIVWAVSNSQPAAR